MNDVRQVSDDEFIAVTHRSSSAITKALHILIGNLCSYLVQMQDKSLSNFETRFQLHTIQSKPNILDVIFSRLQEAWDMVISCKQPVFIKILWLKCLSLNQEVFYHLPKREVDSTRQDYIDEANDIMNMLNKLLTLNESFRLSIETAYLTMDKRTINNSMKKLENNYIKAFNQFKKLESEYKQERTQIAVQMIE